MVDSFVAFPVSIPALRMSASATGSIIAATVCSPIKDDKRAEIVTNPNTIRQVLFPVMLITPSASRLSRPWYTIATASIRDPMIKNTASLMKDEATLSAVATPRMTSMIKIKIATAGKGMDSLIIKVKATRTMIRVRWASDPNPSG